MAKDYNKEDKTQAIISLENLKLKLSIDEQISQDIRNKVEQRLASWSYNADTSICAKCKTKMMHIEREHYISYLLDNSSLLNELCNPKKFFKKRNC